jgi:hypothetical protein
LKIRTAGEYLKYIFGNSSSRAAAAWEICIIFAFFALLLSPVSALASADISYIQSGVSAAAAGMGGAYVTMTDGSDAMHYNPACLYGLKDVEISASSAKSDFGQSYDGFSYSFLNGYKKRAYGGITYIKDDAGEIEGRDAAGNFTKNFGDRAQLLGYAIGNTNEYLKKHGLSYGFMAKYLTHKIADADAGGYGIDAGILKQEPDGRRFGLAVKNIAGKMKWTKTKANPSESLDRIFSAGYSIRCAGNGRLAAEITKDPSGRGKKVTASFGFEKNVSGKTKIRLGLNDGKMCYGAGFLLNRSKIDYAFAGNDYDDIHRISATFYIDDERPRGRGKR